MANIDSPRSRLHSTGSIQQIREMESRTKGQRQAATLLAAGEYSHLMGTDGPAFVLRHRAPLAQAGLLLSAEMTSLHPTLGLSGFFSFSLVTQWSSGRDRRSL